MGLSETLGPKNLMVDRHFPDSHWTNLIGKMMEHDDNRFNQWIGLFGKNCSETISF